ncbi:MAG: nuclear transport factor 2 family protein [Alphaproteobacteria bacterium]|mgnify:CR=1 FL=1
MSEDQALLAANEAFYEAFSSRNLEAMKAIWARHAPTACIHPGWGPLLERGKIIDSWAEILGGPNSPRITCHGARAFRLGDAAFVICFESVQGTFLIATNVFVKEDGEWRMVHHQAGPTNETPDEAAPRPSKTTVH